MQEKGFTLFIAMVVTGTIMLVAFAVVALAVRQAYISNAGKESQLAFYAADTGVECALYWDISSPTGKSAFSTSTATSINCNKNAANPANQWAVGGTATSTIDRINFLPDTTCAIVTVAKNHYGSTTIESRGYNTCNSADPRRVERAIRVTY